MLRRDERVTEGDAATLAHTVSAVVFLTMAVSVNIALSVEEIMRDIRRQVGRPAGGATPTACCWDSGDCLPTWRPTASCVLPRANHRKSKYTHRSRAA
ncbi:hypothetical protein [Streptomyces acidiscabies]|uniref:hypothetical protein n=1 Tax=Streptomyces acidiscabies TaxID=42234 RepID=UPI0038F7EA95